MPARAMLPRHVAQRAFDAVCHIILPLMPSPAAIAATGVARRRRSASARPSSRAERMLIWREAQMAHATCGLRRRYVLLTLQTRAMPYTAVDVLAVDSKTRAAMFILRDMRASAALRRRYAPARAVDACRMSQPPMSRCFACCCSPSRRCPDPSATRAYADDAALLRDGACHDYDSYYAQERRTICSPLLPA